MKYTLATVAIAALVTAGSTMALSAQPGQSAGPDDQQRPRVEQRGPQGQRGPGFFRPGRMGGPFGPGRGQVLRGLDLTDAQREQVKALHSKLRADIEAVLTPEQLEKLKARRGGRLDGRMGR